MIVATIYLNKNANVYGFCLSGHANYSKQGSDIVCSAVSLLVINTVNCIEELTDEETIVTTDSESGTIECILPSFKEDNITDAANLLIKAMVIGLLSLTQNYGKYICIKEEAPND